MKILLVGEYSRLHNSLKEGLHSLGHSVVIIGSGDYFKKYPVDIPIKRKYSSGISKKWKVLLYKLFKIDITSQNIKKQFFKNPEKLKGFDVVQLINESPFNVTPSIEKEFVLFLKNNNKKLFLLSCGTDHLSVKYAFEKKFRYSILNPLFEKKVSEKYFFPILKYLKPKYKSLHKFVFENCNGVIASDMDYHIPLQGNSKYCGLIPNPVNTEKLTYIPLDLDGKLIVFHGINRANYFKKGSDYFEAALKIISEKHPQKIEIITAEDLPYKEYIKKYNRCHILLDQVLSYDQGYNALEAMAKGKVVFTGAEKEFVEFYNLKEKVAINVLPDVNNIVNSLEDLILHPKKIQEISKNARNFIEREHDYITIAKKYIEVWDKN